jgi:hypothetical protein
MPHNVSEYARTAQRLLGCYVQFLGVFANKLNF